MDEERGVVLAEILCRLLVWKGYRVHSEDKPRRDANCPPAVVHGHSYCIDVVTAESLCHVLVGPTQPLKHFCMEIRHREHGDATPAMLARYDLLADFRFGMLAAGHYRHPRHFYCGRIQYGSCFDDARVTRRRFDRLIRLAGPLPGVRSYAETADALGSSQARQHLDVVDQAISENLHAPRSLQALYAALRRGRLSGDERAVLAATGWLFDVSEGPFAGRRRGG